MTDKRKPFLPPAFRGEKSSWDAFVDKYSALVYHSIRKTFTTHHAEPDPEAVNDLFQDFFVVIVRDDFKKLRQFRGDRGWTLASWVRLVAVRMTIDFLRKHEPDHEV